MDTISRENNSMLPVGSIIVAVVALVLGGIALVQTSKANKVIADQQAKIDKIDTVEQEANSAQAAASKNAADVKQLQDQTQQAFNQVGGVLGELRTSMAKLQETAKAPAVAAGRKGSGPVVAGPGEYIVKRGDSGMKIARNNHVSLSQLQSVNPGVNLSRLRIGEKLKLPVKK